MIGKAATGDIANVQLQQIRRRRRVGNGERTVLAVAEDNIQILESGPRGSPCGSGGTAGHPRLETSDSALNHGLDDIGFTLAQTTEIEAADKARAAPSQVSVR